MASKLKKFDEKTKQDDEIGENTVAEKENEENLISQEEIKEDQSPVDIIKVQQDFYESFKDGIANENSHGYVEVLNQEVLKDVIGDTLKLYCNLEPEAVDSFAKILWEQKQLTGTDHLKILQLFVCCVHDYQKAELSYPLDIKSVKFSIHPIYRIPKCFENGAKSQGECCAVFVDELARVYKDWKDFKGNNRYDNCWIITSKDGFYSSITGDTVDLDIFFKNNGVTKVFDTSSAVGSIASAGVMVVGLIPAITLAPAVATGAVVAGGVCAIYTAGRSIYTLFDRKKHKQSIGLRNKESRAAYLNIGAGVLCAGSAAGTQLAKRAALSRQTISAVARRIIRYVGIGSLSLQTMGCADELISIIGDLRAKKPINKVILAQFSAQLFLLAFSYKNFRMTETLTEVSGSRNQKSIRKILRQYNSDGSLKYLFAGADFVDKDIVGFSTQMMLRMMFERCLNVADAVKKECEAEFNLRFRNIHSKPKFRPSNVGEKLSELDFFDLVEVLLKILSFKSVEKFLELSAHTYGKKKEKIDTSYENYVKIVYMTLYKENQQNNMNTVIASITENSFDILTDEIISELASTAQDLLQEFNTEYDNESIDKIDQGRKIYLVIQSRCECFVDELKRFKQSEEDRLELLYDCIEDFLKRLTYDAATVFYGLAKSILNECVLQLPMNEFLREIFRRFVKKFNGNLTDIEKELKTFLTSERKRDEFINNCKADFMSKKQLELKTCSVCRGQGFV